MNIAIALVLVASLGVFFRGSFGAAILRGAVSSDNKTLNVRIQSAIEEAKSGGNIADVGVEVYCCEGKQCRTTIIRRGEKECLKATSIHAVQDECSWVCEDGNSVDDYAPPDGTTITYCCERADKKKPVCTSRMVSDPDQAVTSCGEIRSPVYADGQDCVQHCGPITCRNCKFFDTEDECDNESRDLCEWSSENTCVARPSACCDNCSSLRNKGSCQSNGLCRWGKNNNGKTSCLPDPNACPTVSGTAPLSPTRTVNPVAPPISRSINPNPISPVTPSATVDTSPSPVSGVEPATNGVAVENSSMSFTFIQQSTSSMRQESIQAVPIDDTAPSSQSSSVAPVSLQQQVAQQLSAGQQVTASSLNPFLLQEAKNSNTNPVDCGDRIVSGSEQCDDGNIAAGDGCSAQCVWENTLTNSTKNTVLNFDAPLPQSVEQNVDGPEAKTATLQASILEQERTNTPQSDTQDVKRHNAPPLEANILPNSAKKPLESTGPAAIAIIASAIAGGAAWVRRRRRS